MAGNVAVVAENSDVESSNPEDLKLGLDVGNFAGSRFVASVA